jgi:hypothetical protein
MIGCGDIGIGIGFVGMTISKVFATQAILCVDADGHDAVEGLPDGCVANLVQELFLGHHPKPRGSAVVYRAWKAYDRAVDSISRGVDADVRFHLEAMKTVTSRLFSLFVVVAVVAAGTRDYHVKAAIDMLLPSLSRNPDNPDLAPMHDDQVTFDQLVTRHHHILVEVMSTALGKLTDWASAYLKVQRLLLARKKAEAVIEEAKQTERRAQDAHAEAREELATFSFE